MTAACPTLAFIVNLTPDPGCREHALRTLEGAWIAFLVTRALTCHVRGRDASIRVVVSEASQATEADRVATDAWLAGRRDVVRWTIGPLFDLQDD
ncbi:MAG: DUF469 family protein [Gemmatimonadetes bacterium]|nr:DUF469 family protein [Gemmatimonadota bacterium]MCC6769799.1 DUF469 family protein [Gemmatimonadaceae bacterium]